MWYFPTLVQIVINLTLLRRIEIPIFEFDFEKTDKNDDDEGETIDDVQDVVEKDL